jgi:hypothetical protein
MVKVIVIILQKKFSFVTGQAYGEDPGSYWPGARAAIVGARLMPYTKEKSENSKPER